jgi:DNA-binding FrmR family transcriptional regulator
MSKSCVQRLNNISGQIKGVAEMMDKKSDCIEVLTQLKAVRSAISSLMNKIVEEKVDSCFESEKTDKKTIKEILIKINN